MALESTVAGARHFELSKTDARGPRCVCLRNKRTNNGTTKKRVELAFPQMLLFGVVDNFEAFCSFLNELGPVEAVPDHLEPCWTTPFGMLVAHLVPFSFGIFPKYPFWTCVVHF